MSTVKRIQVLPGAIQANKKDQEDRKTMYVMINQKKYYCDSIEIDGPSKLVYDRKVGVWVETEAAVTCVCGNGNKVFE